MKEYSRYELYFLYSECGVSASELAEKTGKKRTTINSLLHEEKVKRSDRAFPYLPTMEDALKNKFDKEHHLDRHNSSVKIWRNIARNAHMICHSENDEIRLWNSVVAGMTADDLDMVKGIGIKCKSIFNDFKSFVREFLVGRDEIINKILFMPIKEA